MGYLYEREEIEALEMESTVLGYKKYLNPVKIDSKLKKIADLSLPYYLEGYKGNFIKSLVTDKTLDDKIKIGKTFMKTNFDLHEVLSFKDNSWNDNLEQTINSLSDEEALVYIKDKITKISPYDLPINYTNDYLLTGQVNFILLVFGDNEYNQQIKAIILNINISKSSFDEIPYIYIHELAHTQLTSIRGSIKNYNHGEVISIFLELVSALENDPTGNLVKQIESVYLSQLYDSIRLLSLKDVNIPISDAMEGSKNIVSVLKALRLFDEYEKANIFTRQDIVNGIQDIFDGKITVEDYLKDNGISFKNSKDTSLIKKRIRNL